MEMRGCNSEPVALGSCEMQELQLSVIIHQSTLAGKGRPAKVVVRSIEEETGRPARAGMWPERLSFGQGGDSCGLNRRRRIGRRKINRTTRTTLWPCSARGLVRITDFVAGPPRPRLMGLPIHVRRPVRGGTIRSAAGTALEPVPSVGDQAAGGAALRATMMVAMVMIVEPGRDLRRIWMNMRRWLGG